MESAPEPPPFLHALLTKIAVSAGRSVEEFKQIGINEYRPGAGIGWHRDKPQFGEIVGVSLLSAVKMRFRRRDGNGWVMASQQIEPRRSVYMMTGEIRNLWEHGIAVISLRYSVTLATIRD